MRIMARALVIPLVLIGCAPATPMTWMPSADTTDAVTRDAYECERDTRAVFGLKIWQAPDSKERWRAFFYGLSGTEPSAATQYMQAGQFYRQCMRVRGWQENER